MALASGNAALPPDGRWFLGDPHRPSDKTYGEGDPLSARRTPGGVTRFHQEDTDNAGRRFGFGAQTQEGVGAMSEEHMGSSIDVFLKEEGIFEEAQARIALNCFGEPE